MSFLLSPVVLTQPRSRQVAITVSILPDTVETALSAPDDGRRYHTKHVEQLGDINKPYSVASFWIIIDTHYTMFGPLDIKFAKFVFPPNRLIQTLDKYLLIFHIHSFSLSQLSTFFRLYVKC